MIRRGLIRIATALGRWILRRVSRRGIERVLGYMDGKIEDFKRRLRRARADWRIRWLRGRIKRWQLAMRWLERRRRQITKTIVDAVDREMSKRLAMVAPGERFDQWCKGLSN